MTLRDSSPLRENEMGQEKLSMEDAQTTKTKMSLHLLNCSDFLVLPLQRGRGWVSERCRSRLLAGKPQAPRQFRQHVLKLKFSHCLAFPDFHLCFFDFPCMVILLSNLFSKSMH